MAGRQVNIEKQVQVNPATGWVRGKIWCMENNRLLGAIEFDAMNWAEFEAVLGAAQSVKEAYTAKIQRV